MGRKKPKPEPNKTGPHTELLQDDCRGLSKWFASKPDAMLRARQAVNDIKLKKAQNGNSNVSPTASSV